MKDRVFWKKPEHNLLSQLGHTMVDMHFHTCYSDGNASIPNLINRAKKLGIGVAVTDHNEIGGAIEAYKNKDGVLVIPGIEVSCIEGPHILLYFYNIKELTSFFENFLKKKKNGNPFMATKATVKEVLNEAGKYNCIKIAAHPFGYMGVNCGLLKTVGKDYVKPNLLRKIDGVEVICGAMNRHLNKQAQTFAQAHKMIYTGGTDGHCLFQLGKVVTLGKGKTAKEFLDSMKKRENILIGKETQYLPKMLSASTTVKTHLHYAYPSVKIQTRIFYERTNHLRKKITGKLIHNGLTRQVGKIVIRKM
ncbi:MAG: PHP domain-containing protein [Nanoarchaeota archaeon]